MLSQAKFKKDTSSSEISDLSLTDGSSEEDMVTRAFKKEKKTKKVKKKAKQAKKVIKEKAPEPKAVAKGVKDQGKRVVKTAKENVTPENIGKIYNDPGEAINIVTDIITGKRLIPESDRSKATEITMKQKYNILVDHIKELEGIVNRCCEDKKLRSNIQFADGEKLFEKNLADIKSESKQKYIKAYGVAKGVVKKVTPDKVNKDLLVGLSGEKEVGNIIRRYTNMDQNALIWETIKSIMIHLQQGGDPNMLTPVQQRIIDEIRILIEYSNKNPKKGVAGRIGLRLSDILRLIMGYYVFSLVDKKIVTYNSDELFDGVPFGYLRYRVTRETLFEPLLNFFKIYFKANKINKGDIRSIFTKLLESKERVDDSIIIQNLYDKGGVKKKKISKKPKKTIKKKKKK